MCLFAFYVLFVLCCFLVCVVRSLSLFGVRVECRSLFVICCLLFLGYCLLVGCCSLFVVCCVLYVVSC